MLTSEVSWFAVSGDGTRLVIGDDHKVRVVPSDRKVDNGSSDDAITVDLSRARFSADPAALWAHAYEEFGRLLRRDFWTATMSERGLGRGARRLPLPARPDQVLGRVRRPALGGRGRARHVARLRHAVEHVHRPQHPPRRPGGAARGGRRPARPTAAGWSSGCCRASRPTRAPARRSAPRGGRPARATRSSRSTAARSTRSTAPGPPWPAPTASRSRLTIRPADPSWSLAAADPDDDEDGDAATADAPRERRTPTVRRLRHADPSTRPRDARHS